MTAKPELTPMALNEQAAFLTERPLDLIKQVLVKHSAAVLEEMRDQIVSRNVRISKLETDLAAANRRIAELEKDVRDLGLDYMGCREDRKHYRERIAALEGVQ